ncbi:hypothetical protein BSZ19_04860 [Bradyrhizobium japonicum]|uniref:Recombinase RecT n=1 Tax=Bradyrhizobium japonicum TaxID=375 RepID=A0A1Y2JW64_BRAJP|nr:hypothetical protein [Bradyrhizobium japonicum]OSJ36315.1 hypothetical protein BSZ19_04860 [Bradyrhizobium japonicum]
MTDTTTMEDPGRVTRRDLAEGRIEKVLSPERTSLIPMNDVMGGLKFENAFQLAEAAKLMATAGPILPPWLQGNVGGCWAVLLRSQETGISALALAQMMYVTEKHGVQRVGYDSVYFRTMVEKFAPIKARLAARYEGEGDDLVCIVSATFKGETEPRQFPPVGTEKEFTLGKLRPERNERGQIKGSPLWEDKPALQMFYAMSRDWARMYCADIVAGAYSREELVGAGYTEVVEVTRPSDLPPRLRERLRGPDALATDMTADIDAAIRSARVEENPEHKRSGKTIPAGQAADEVMPSAEAASSPPPPAHGDGAATIDQPKEQNR